MIVYRRSEKEMPAFTDEIEEAFELAAKFGGVLAEKWVSGEEYTVAWLADTVLPAIKLETPHVFYDYDAKYSANDTRYYCPCGLSEKKLLELNKIVSKTIDVCDLRHWGRIDLMLDEQGVFQVIEANTVPGMTDHSLVPMAAKQAGLNFKQLVLKVLELTVNKEVLND